jgi:hypothetical protein
MSRGVGINRDNLSLGVPPEVCICLAKLKLKGTQSFLAQLRKQSRFLTTGGKADRDSEFTLLEQSRCQCV